MPDIMKYGKRIYSILFRKRPAHFLLLRGICFETLKPCPFYIQKNIAFYLEQGKVDEEYLLENQKLRFFSIDLATEIKYTCKAYPKSQTRKVNRLKGWCSTLRESFLRLNTKTPTDIE